MTANGIVTRVCPCGASDRIRRHARRLIACISWLAIGAGTANAACSVTARSLTLSAPSSTYAARGGAPGIVVTFTATYSYVSSIGGGQDCDTSDTRRITITPAATGGRFTRSTCRNINPPFIVGTNTGSVSCTATWTAPANPAARYVLRAIASSAGTPFDIATSNTLTFSRLPAPTPASLTAISTGLVTTGTVGAVYGAGAQLHCSNAAGASAATQAACTATGLPPGLVVGACTPATPVASLNGSSAIACPVSGTPIAAGTYAVRVTASATNATSVTAPTTITIAPANQTIAFTPPAAQTFSSGGSVGLAATGGASGHPVVFTSNSAAVCTTGGANGATVTFTGVGTCSITASQAGTTNYDAATPVTATFAITAPPLTTVAVIPSLIYTAGTASVAASPVTAGGGTAPLSAAVVPGLPSGLMFNATTGEITGTPAVAAPAGTYTLTFTDSTAPMPQTSAKTFNLTVLQADQSIALAASPSPLTFGQTASVTLTDGAGVGAVTYAVSGPCTLDAPTLVLRPTSGVGTCTVSATKAPDTRYASVSASLTVPLGQATQTIVFTPPASLAFTPGGTMSLSATGGASGLAVSFTSASPLVCTIAGQVVTIVSAGICQIVANQAGNAQYLAAEAVTRSIAITKAATSATVISSVNPSVIDQPVTFKATVAPTDAAGTVTFRAGSIVLGTATLVAGSVSLQTSALGAGSHTVTADYSGSSNYQASTSAPLIQTVKANGSITLRVVTDTDGQFTFISTTAGLTSAVTTSGGTGQTAPISLNAGTYTIGLGLPAGFGLTAITCTDPDSTGNVATAMAELKLASGEALTCTFTTLNSRRRTVNTAARFMGQRNNQILSNGPETDRQIDRLIDFHQELGAQPSSSGLSGSPVADGEAHVRLGAVFSTRRTGPENLGSRDPAGNVPGVNSSGMPDFGVAPVPSIFNAESSVTEPVPASGAGPFRFTGSGDGPLQLAFSTSLSQINKFALTQQVTRNNAHVEAGSVASQFDPRHAPRTVYRPSALDLWFDARYANFRDNRSVSLNDGAFGIVHVGADVILNRSVLVGAYVAFDHMQQIATGTGSIEGRGWMAGPYATIRVNDNIYVQGRAAWGRTINRISPFLTYVDSFDTERWLVIGAIKGRWASGPWQFRPSATLAFIEDRSTAYTDSLGVEIPEIKSSLGQFKLGPKLSYRHVTADGYIVEPRLALEAIHNFVGSNVTVDGIAQGPDGMRGRIELGARVTTPTGVSLDLSASYDGLGVSTYESIAVRGWLRAPLN